MTPESRNSGGRARRPLLDNGSVIMFPQQRIRLRKKFTAYRVTSISEQRIQTRFRSRGNEPPKHSNSEERDNSIAEGGVLHTVRPEPTSGKELTNRGQNTTEHRRCQKKSEVRSEALVYVVLSLFVVTKCYSYSKTVLQIIRNPLITCRVTRIRDNILDFIPMYLCPKRLKQNFSSQY
jgi:hypothetical protein